MRYLPFLAVLFILGGCATGDMASFTDPAFKGHRFTHFAVVTPGVNSEGSPILQNAMCNAIKQGGAACTPGQGLFPPTRTYPGPEVVKILKRNGIDAFLVLIPGGRTYRSQFLGTRSYGSPKVYTDTVTNFESTVPMRSYSRDDGYSILLIDSGTYNKAWVADAITYPQAQANISDEAFASGFANRIAANLGQSGLLAK